MKTKYPLINNNGDFASFCRKAMEMPAVGIDTEFVWTRTYYPQLGLLQMAYSREDGILADPLAITDTAPFRELMEKPSVRKVFHEASSDLPILNRWCGAVPKNVADTRVAGGFCGLTGRMSLAKLLFKQLGVNLNKSETLTDWMQRPLTDAQLAYAGNDVAYLPELMASLDSMLESFGNKERFEEEMSRYCQPEFYAEVAPEDYWRRVSYPKYLRFTLQDFAVFQNLVAWRERVGRERDITRNRIAKDATLAVMAVKHPYTMDEIYRTVGVWPHSVRKYGEEIIEVVKTSMKLPKEAWPLQALPNVDSQLLRIYCERIHSLAQKRAEANGIEASFVCTKHDAQWLVSTLLEKRDASESLLLNGWRHELLGNSIDKIIEEIKKAR